MQQDLNHPLPYFGHAQTSPGLTGHVVPLSRAASWKVAKLQRVGVADVSAPQPGLAVEGTKKALLLHVPSLSFRSYFIVLLRQVFWTHPASPGRDPKAHDEEPGLLAHGMWWVELEEDTITNINVTNRCDPKTSNQIIILRMNSQLDLGLSLFWSVVLFFEDKIRLTGGWSFA